MYLCDLFAVKMEILKCFRIPFKGLKTGSHHFDIDVDSTLFEAFGGDEIKDGKLKASIDMLKSATMLTFDVSIRGEVTVACDRCLEDCILPVDFSGQLIVKFSDQTDEYDGNVMWIGTGETEVDLGQYVYESIVLSLPYSRVHAEGECNPDMLARFSSVSEEEFKRIEAEAMRNAELEESNRRQWAKLEALKSQMEKEGRE